MGFFKDLRDDISQAVNELLPDEDFFGIEEEDTENEEFLQLEEEKEKTVNGEVEEDILAALAHLGEEITVDSDVEAIEPESVNEETMDSEEESAIVEEVQEEISESELEKEFVTEVLPEEHSLNEDDMEDVLAEESDQMPELDFAQKDTEEFSLYDNTESQEMEFELPEDIETEHIDMEPSEAEEAVEVSDELENLITETLEIETEEELSNEENESELLNVESEFVQLEEEILGEEPNKELEEISFDNDNDFEKEEVRELEIGTIAEAIVETDEDREEEDLSLTNTENLDTMEEENKEEIVEENSEDVSVIEDLETSVEQWEGEESMSRGKKAEVSEPMIEENIIEKEENIMENNLENVQATDQVTVITKGTVINGSISSDGGLEVNGTITGDVECLGKLTINGNVSGNLKAAEVVVSTPRLDGGIDSQGDVKIGVGTIVVGDVTAKSATVSGAVKGEIDVQGPVVVDSTAIVKGNITAKSVQINNGAVVDGYCKLSYAEVDIDNFFDGE